MNMTAVDTFVINYEKVALEKSIIFNGKFMRLNELEEHTSKHVIRVNLVSIYNEELNTSYSMEVLTDKDVMKEIRSLKRKARKEVDKKALAMYKEKHVGEKFEIKHILNTDASITEEITI